MLSAAETGGARLLTSRGQGVSGYPTGSRGRSRRGTLVLKKPLETQIHFTSTASLHRSKMVPS